MGKTGTISEKPSPEMPLAKHSFTDKVHKDTLTGKWKDSVATVAWNSHGVASTCKVENCYSRWQKNYDTSGLSICYPKI
jgi:hypothetical protein